MATLMVVTASAGSTPYAAAEGTHRQSTDEQALDTAIDAHIEAVNDRLEARRSSIRLQSAEAFTLGWGQLRVGNRFKKYYGQRWVPGDERRLADGDRLTYLFDQSDGSTSSGLASADTEAAIDRAMATWGAERCLEAAPLVKRVDTGVDPDSVDGLLVPDSYESTEEYVADIVFAGWYPVELFSAFAPTFGGRVLAFSESYVFVDPVTLQPTDVNHDGYLDTAFNEVYFNDLYGDPSGPRSDRPWGIDVEAGPAFDVETVALHEFGHSFGLGHFGSPPVGIMNPAPPNDPGRPLTYRSDRSALCSLYADWPLPRY